MQATRPQTLAYLLNDSPVGQLAWIVEKFREWTDPAAQLLEDAVDRDQLLTNVSLLGVSVFAADTTVRDVMDPAGRIAHWSEFDRGGHSPAMEVPHLLAQDIRAFFRDHR